MSKKKEDKKLTKDEELNRDQALEGQQTQQNIKNAENFLNKKELGIIDSLSKNLDYQTATTGGHPDAGNPRGNENLEVRMSKIGWIHYNNDTSWLYDKIFDLHSSIRSLFITMGVKANVSRIKKPRLLRFFLFQIELY